MKKLFVLLTAFLLLSCNPNQYVKVNQNQVIITDFKWSGNPQEYGSMRGDYETLDKEVFESLKGQSGIFTIMLVDNGFDKYGNKTSKRDSIGTIDADILNKYQTKTYWKNDTGGTLSIFGSFIGMKSIYEN